MTTFARHPKTFPLPAKQWIGERVLVAWPCMRADGGPTDGGPSDDAGRGLERLQVIVSVEPIDQHHAALEAWIERDGQPPRRLLERQIRRCVITEDGGLLHIDQPNHAERLLALTLSRCDDGPRLVYARTPLLSRAGFASSAFDAPTLRSTSGTSPGRAAG